MKKILNAVLCPCIVLYQVLYFHPFMSLLFVHSFINMNNIYIFICFVRKSAKSIQIKTSSIYKTKRGVVGLVQFYLGKAIVILPEVHTQHNNLFTAVHKHRKHITQHTHAQTKQRRKKNK